MFIGVPPPQLRHRVDNCAGIDRSLFDGIQQVLSFPREINHQKLERIYQAIVGKLPRDVRPGALSSQCIKFGRYDRPAFLWTSYREGYPHHPTTIAMIGGPSISPMFSFPRDRLDLNEAGHLRIPHFLGVLAACGDDGLELRHFISVSYMDLEAFDADPEKTKLAQRCEFDKFEGIQVTNPRSPQYHGPATPGDAVWAKSALDGHHEFVLCQAEPLEQDKAFWSDPSGSLGPLRGRVEPRAPYMIGDAEEGSGYYDDGRPYSFSHKHYSDGRIVTRGFEPTIADD